MSAGGTRLRPRRAGGVSHFRLEARTARVSAQRRRPATWAGNARGRQGFWLLAPGHRPPAAPAGQEPGAGEAS